MANDAFLAMTNEMSQTFEEAQEAIEEEREMWYHDLDKQYETPEEPKVVSAMAIVSMGILLAVIAASVLGIFAFVTGL